MKATSPYLNRPLRTEAAVLRHAREACLEAMADKLDRGAQSNSPGIADPQRAKFGRQQADQSFAIRKTLRENAELRRANATLRLQLDPLTEGPRQILAEIVGVP